MKTFIADAFNTLCENTNILFVTFLALFFTYSPSNAGTLIFNQGFDSGRGSFVCSGNCPTTTSDATVGAASGSFALTRDMPVNYRTEATLGKSGNLYIGQEYWFSYDFNFRDWAIDKDTDTGGLQMHLVPATWKVCSEGAMKSSPFLFSTRNDELKFVTFGGITRWTQPLKKQQWQSVMIHFIPSANSDGLIEAWVDGVQIASVSGINMKATDPCGNAYKPYTYIKLGVYKWTWKKFATQSARREVLIDDVKVASGFDGNSLVGP